MKINCLHDECIEVSVDWEPSFYQLNQRTDFTPNTETVTAQIEAAAKFIGKVMESDEFKQKANLLAEGIKVQERHAKKAYAKHKKSQETGIYTTGGIVPAVVESNQENVAERSKEKIKSLRESIIKEYRDGL